MQDLGFYAVEQAVDTLDLTSGRIRQRLRGGNLEGSKEPGDRGWRITRESVEEVRRRRPPPRERGGATEDRGELVEALRREDEYLRRQLDQSTERDRENRRLLAAGLQTETSQPQRSIWRRLFGR